jgi:hypothetical protein
MSARMKLEAPQQLTNLRSISKVQYNVDSLPQSAPAHITPTNIAPSLLLLLSTALCDGAIMYIRVVNGNTERHPAATVGGRPAIRFQRRGRIIDRPDVGVTGWVGYKTQMNGTRGISDGQRTGPLDDGTAVTGDRSGLRCQKYLYDIRPRRPDSLFAHGRLTRLSGCRVRST